MGAAKEWVQSNVIKPLPAWITKSEVAAHMEEFKKSGYTRPLNMFVYSFNFLFATFSFPTHSPPHTLTRNPSYKSRIRNLDSADNALIPEANKFVTVPTLVVVSDKDYAARAEIAKSTSPVRLRNYTLVEIEDCGHWIQLEKRNELSGLLVQFAKNVTGGV